tara:strand:+ start:70 stop:369 length:300 start_codon:yes stop_codon:yes gene_type:complete
MTTYHNATLPTEIYWGCLIAEMFFIYDGVHPVAKIIKKEEEGICCKCKTDYEVEQCMECDKYICEECDTNGMATYSYDGEGIHCEPCAIANGFALGALG